MGDDKITAVEQELAILKHRTDGLEKQSSYIQDLLLSVQKLNMSIEQMVKEQVKQGERLEKLEKEPANNAKKFKEIVLTVVVTVVIGGILGFIMGKVGF